jgi:hypothetical protein
MSTVTSINNAVIAQDPLPDSLAPVDVIKNIEDRKVKENERMQIIKDKSQQTEQERAMLQKYIYDNANPSPVLIACLAFGLIVILYVLYLLFLKPSTSGEWHDVYGNIWILNHNLLNGRIKVNINGRCAGSGKVIDNFVRYGDLTGVWDYNNEIAFTEGWSIYRPE